MGDMADQMIQDGFDALADHNAGHTHIRPEDCPFCTEEEEHFLQDEFNRLNKESEA